MNGARSICRLGVIATLVFLLAQPASALIRYIAFGDSITFGIGDPEEKGYPIRLKRLLEKSLGMDVQIVKSGVPGEETSGALARIEAAVAQGGDALLLMEGTNDVTRISEGVLSMETVMANLDAMALAAKRRGIEPIHVTIIPRSPKALRDRDQKLTTLMAQEIRALAAHRKRRLIDVFQAWDPELVPDFYDLYFFAGYDPVGHPNSDGYKEIAGIFGDVLLENDLIPPVLGPFVPGTLPAQVPPDIEFRVPLYEPPGASGINQKETALLINGIEVGDSRGNRRTLELVFQDEEAIGCRVVLSYRTQDRANPPNTAERILDIYSVTDREVLVGDVDFDCLVNGHDLVELGLAFGSEAGDDRYQRRFDLNVDDIIDSDDLKALGKNFSKSSL